MKTHSWLVIAVLCSAVLTGCGERLDYDSPDVIDSNRINQYTNAWVKTIGLIPEGQDWCMLDALEANVSTAALGQDVYTELYSAAPAAGGHVIGAVMGDARLMVDVPRGSTALYAVMRALSGEVLAEGHCTAHGGSVTVAPSTLVPAGQSRYAHSPEASYFDAMIVCEDLGSVGDFDFNDIVLGLRHIAGLNQLKITPMAAGGKLEARVLFQGEELGEIHSLVRKDAGAGVFLNTDRFDGAGHVIAVDVPDGWTIANDWGDISLQIGSKGAAYDIKAPHELEAPQMLCLGGDFFWPAETKDITLAYSKFKAWATGNYTDTESTWIDDKVDELVVPWDINSVRSWFVGTTTDGNPYTFQGRSVASGEVVYVDDPTHFNGWFGNQTNLKTLDMNGSHFDTSSVTMMMYTFIQCYNLESIDLRGWDTSKVTNMNMMFQRCTKLTDFDVRGWDTSSVTSMNNMFQETPLTSLDLSRWDTSSVTNLGGMFYLCSNLTSLDLSTWDTSHVTTMGSMFEDCVGLTSLNLSGWDTTSVTNMPYIFDGCTNLTSLDLSGWELNNSVDLGYTSFKNCPSDMTIYYTVDATKTKLESYAPAGATWIQR